MLSFSIDSTLIASGDIEFYNWKSHTITLMPGVRERLSQKLAGDLVGGHAFQITANGQAFYHGNFTSSVSSTSLNTVVINLHPLDETVAENQIRLELGYPTREFFKGNDPRNADGIRESLMMARKIKD